jgi:hypothetical protein
LSQLLVLGDASRYLLTPAATQMDNQAAYFETHPPKCIAAYIAEPTQLADVTFDGHGEQLNPTFAIGCQCGHRRFIVLGHYTTNRDILIYVSPLALRCESCHAITELLDTDVHGYDAELGHGATTIRVEGEFEEFKCDQCGPIPMEIYTRFEYPDDLFDDDMPECRGREQELFTWFSLHARCSGCSRMLDVTDFECA